jgi:hypothetical protein
MMALGGLMGCGLRLGAPILEVQKSGKTLAVTTTNYQTGALALFDVENRLAQLRFSPVFSDAVVKSFVETPDIFVINRLGADNIQRIDRRTGKTLQQFSVGVGVNPQDMVLIGGTAYVSCLQIPELLKINLETGTIVKRINLSQFSDGDGSPEATRMILKGNRLWIQLQKLNQTNSFAPVGTAQVVIIDTNTDLINQVVDLGGTNPVSEFKSAPDGKWLLADAGLVGSQSQLDGGVEIIDPQKEESLGFLTTESKLGGDLVDFECINSKECLAIISKPQTELIVFDFETGLKLRTLWSSSGYDLRQILRDKEAGLIYVADGNAVEPKIRIWDEANLQQRTDLNWALELPPYQMEFLR